MNIISKIFTPRLRQAGIAQILVVVVLLFIFFVPHAYAVVSSYGVPCISESAFPCESAGDFRGFLARFFSFSYAISGILGVFMVAFGGFLWAFSAFVNQQARGRKIIENTLWGLALLSGSYMILRTVNPAIVDFTRLPGGRAAEELQVTRLTAQPCTGNPSELPGQDCLMYCTPDELLNHCDITESPDDTGCIPCLPNPEQLSLCNASILESCEPRRIAVPLNSSAVTLQNVPDCKVLIDNDVITLGNFSCDNGFYTRRIRPTIEPGGAYWQYPYYPQVAGPEYAQCVPYAWQEERGGYLKDANMAGLKKC